jgi:hypothetical protein
MKAEKKALYRAGKCSSGGEKEDGVDESIAVPSKPSYFNSTPALQVC